MQKKRVMTKTSAAKWGLLTLILAGVVAFWLLPGVKAAAHDGMKSALEWVHEMGPWGPIALALIYVVAAVFFVPGSLLTLGAGFLFGVFWGTISVSVGSTLGACAAFLLGRTIARQWVADQIAQRPRFRALDQAVLEQGFRIVLLVRLAPVFPYNFSNYAFAMTKVRFRDYALATWIGMLPATVAYVYIGTFLADLAHETGGDREPSFVRKALLFGGAAASIAATIVIARIAGAALYRNVNEAKINTEPSIEADSQS
jgi:uncharacterized membrane protein YdjX (TVP38/TMEM64 family)